MEWLREQIEDMANFRNRRNPTDQAIRQELLKILSLIDKMNCDNCNVFRCDYRDDSEKAGRTNFSCSEFELNCQ